METYEYKVLFGSSHTKSSPELDKQLTSFGSDGFRLVNAFQLTLPKEGWQLCYVFERPTRNAPK